MASALNRTEDDLKSRSMLGSFFSWISARKIPRIMYEEGMAAVVYGVAAISIEHWIFPYLMNNAGSPWLVAVPLTFFLILCLMRPFEDRLHNLILPRSAEILNYKGSTVRFQRILQNVALLGTLLLVHASPVNRFNLITDEEIDSGLKENLEWVPYQYLLFMLRVSRKLRGAFALVIIYRIYTDLAIQTSSHLMGYPDPKDVNFTPPELEEERRLAQEGEQRKDNANGNMDNGNHSDSETEPVSD